MVACPCLLMIRGVLSPRSTDTLVIADQVARIDACHLLATSGEQMSDSEDYQRHRITPHTKTTNLDPMQQIHVPQRNKTVATNDKSPIRRRPAFAVNL